MAEKLAVIYLAMAIDKSDPIKQVKMIDEVRACAKKADIHLAAFLPALAYFLPDSEDRAAQAAVREINECVLTRSACVLVLYEPGVETWGISQEVRLAEQNKVPVMLVSQDADVPLPIYLNLCITRRFSSVQEFFDSFKERDRWKC